MVAENMKRPSPEKVDYVNVSKAYNTLLSKAYSNFIEVTTFAPSIIPNIYLPSRIWPLPLIVKLRVMLILFLNILQSLTQIFFDYLVGYKYFLFYHRYHCLY